MRILRAMLLALGLIHTGRSQCTLNVNMPKELRHGLDWARGR